MGGVPPLGYDIIERKLVIHPAEAEVVKTCFQTYLDKTGLIETVIELNRLGLKTKSFTSVKGRVQEGKPWVAKQLHRTLSNPVYRGMIQHKAKLQEGEHQAIIDETLWNQVYKKLREHQPEFRKTGGHLNEIAIDKSRLIHPLKGFVHGIDGQALTPTYTNKSHKQANGNKVRKRYRYYISQQAIRQGYKSSILKTINAHLLEEAVRQALIQSLPRLGNSVSSEEFSKEQIQHRLGMHAATLSRTDSSLDFARWIAELSPKIVVGPEILQIHISHPKLSQLVGTLPVYPESETSETIVRPTISVEVHQSDDETTLTAKIEFKQQRGRVKVIDGCTGNSVSPSRSEPNATLIQTIVQAEFWRAELQKHPSKPLNEVTRKLNTEPAYVRRLLNAAYLAPAIKRAIFQGTQPATLQVQDLIRQRSADWQVQILELGFGKILPTARH